MDFLQCGNHDMMMSRQLGDDKAFDIHCMQKYSSNYMNYTNIFCPTACE